jgi:hypothetical protein
LVRAWCISWEGERVVFTGREGGREVGEGREQCRTREGTMQEGRAAAERAVIGVCVTWQH